jgi:hypothetical protein
MSRRITANDRIPLWRWLCEAYEMSSGIARREIIEWKNVRVNGRLIIDFDFEVKDNDVVVVMSDVGPAKSTVVDIPHWFRDSCRKSK